MYLWLPGSGELSSCLTFFFSQKLTGEWEKKRTKTCGQRITLGKVKWPPTLTRVSRHGHYLPAAHTDTQTACKQCCPHGTQLHSQLRKQITWLMCVLMMLLTLMSKGTHMKAANSANYGGITQIPCFTHGVGEWAIDLARMWFYLHLKHCKTQRVEVCGCFRIHAHLYYWFYDAKN